MTIGSFLLGLLIASIFGFAMHFWKGGSMKWLVLFLLIAWAGFWGGHLVSKLMGFEFIPLGPINLGPAIIGSLLFLGLGYWLSMAGQEGKARKN